MSPPITIAFDYTDADAARATRENWISFGRRTFTLGMLALAAASTAIFVLALRRPASLFWLILAGASPALLVIMIVVWVGALWWAPRAAQKKLARLTHRHVTLQLTDTDLIIVTANERLESKWVEVRELRDLPHFHVIVLASGAQIPLPREAVSQEARDWLHARIASS